MAKTPSKSASKEPKKAPAKTSKPKNTSDPIEKASVEALEKLKALNIEQDLQNDLSWCLGSYRSDRNPVGLIAMLERTATVFRTEKDKKTKGVTAKHITDLEKVIQNK
jgi:hypothetical protein